MGLGVFVGGGGGETSAPVKSRVAAAMAGKSASGARGTVRVCTSSTDRRPAKSGAGTLGGKIEE